MNLPTDFTIYTRRLIGEEAYARLEEALGQEPPASIRVNGRKSLPEDARRFLQDSAAQVGWCATGYYLPERLAYTFDPLFHAGCYYVQEASSMFVEQALRTYVTCPVVMLDLCAAPGGKSTLARSVLPEGSLLVANEPVRNRSQVLAENLMKWGHPGVIVTRNEPADFAALPAFFDVVLADVPCSGEGMFRKDEGAAGEWSRSNVERCRNRQREIIGQAWEALKPGGLIIYSTCTYNIEENEENVAWMEQRFGAEALPVPLRPEWQVTGDLSGRGLPVCRFLPHLTKGEGFFLAVLRKPGAAAAASCREAGRQRGKGARKAAKAAAPVPASCKRSLLHEEAYHWEACGSRAVAFPLACREAYRQVAGCLNVMHAGVTVGEWKGKDFIPHPSLALCTDLRTESFPIVPLSYEQAVAYLRKEALSLPPDTPHGYVLLAYRDVPLGFAKQLGNRANNLYPQEWRIRSGYLPETVRCL